MSEKEVVKAIVPEPPRRAEWQKLAAERVAEIAKEFTAGFEFLADYPKSVTFFGSSKAAEGDFYYGKARELSARIVRELGYAVVSGGGPGIMEAADRGAFEAGGTSIGLLINLPNAQPTNAYIKKSISFYHFFARKVCLAFGAEEFIFFPGGYGTLDEFFEIITLLQTHKLSGAPVICFGSEYWNQMKELIDGILLERGLIDKGDEKLYMITDDLDIVMEKVRKAPIHEGIPLELGTAV